MEQIILDMVYQNGVDVIYGCGCKLESCMPLPDNNLDLHCILCLHCSAKKGQTSHDVDGRNHHPQYVHYMKTMIAIHSTCSQWPL